MTEAVQIALITGLTVAVPSIVAAVLTSRRTTEAALAAKSEAAAAKAATLTAAKETAGQIEEVHLKVNSQLDRALAKIETLTKQLARHKASRRQRD